MSLTFKLLSLGIRTAAKPIGNYIKRQAKEHDGFRRFAVSQAQRVHRIDMRMRLGILHDPEAQQRMHEREQRAAEEKKRKAEMPMVRTEEEQKKYDQQQAKEDVAAEDKKKDERPPKPKIRPLSEARAIELGANFFSEAFVFAVAAGLIFLETWRNRRKEGQRRDDVADRLEQLEAEVEGLRSRLDPDLETIHDLSERIKEARQQRPSWWNPAGWGRSAEDTAIMEEGRDARDARVEEDKPLVAMHKARVAAAEKAERAEKDEGKSEKLAKETKHAKEDLARVEASTKKAEEKKSGEGKGNETPPVGVDCVTASTKGR